METFQSIHQDCLMGSLTTFDRMIFKGHLTMLYPQGAFARLLSRQGVLLKDFKPYVQEISQQIKQHAQQLAEAAGRPYRYLPGAQTARNGQGRKEGLAKQIATEDEVEEGLICVFSTLEACSTFTVRGNRATQKLEVVRRKTKCLHFYFYYLDAELGFIHLRLQSWFPFQIQVYVNGRECLARHLDQQDIAYERYDNCFTQMDDLAAAQDFCEQFAHFDWPPVLNHLAQQVNPLLKTIRESGFRGYYWVADQCEIATDLMFSNRASLAAILPDLFEHAILQTACQDVLRFLGRKLHGNFKGEVTTSLKQRAEGWRAKHSMKRNAIKLYDKHSVLRIETTINNPSEFKICHQTDNGKLRWKPLRKGVSNLYRYAQVGQQANQRYLDHLAQAKLKRKAIPHLDRLCRNRTINGKRCARFNPLQDADRDLFAAVLSGEFALNGFRNRDLRAKLYPQPPSSDKEARRRCTRTSRLIAKLRGHGLIAKVKDARLYRVTKLGSQVLFAVLSFYHADFPTAFQCA